MIKTDTNTAINEARNHLDAGNIATAQQMFHDLIEQEIDDKETRVSLGRLAIDLGEKVIAITIFQNIAEENPDNAYDKINLAYAYTANSLQAMAEPLLKEAIELDNAGHEAHKRLGMLYVQQGRYNEAIAPLKKAYELKPSDRDVMKGLISAYSSAFLHTEARKLAEKLVRLEPRSAQSYQLLGRALSGLGEFDGAIENYKKSISLDKTYGYAYIDLSRIKKFTEDDADLIETAKKSLGMSMPAEKRATIMFSLGKIYNDLKDYDAAFEYYRQGNLIHKVADFDDTAEILYKKSRKVYTRKLYRDNKEYASDSTVPVFVVGMPRSGTTLTEQIIASHPDADGAGELLTISNISAKLFPYDELDDYKEKFIDFYQTERVKQAAGEYLDVLRSNREGASRVVDKLPDNFIYLGLIHYLFPNAKIVHAIRSPLDTCLSCYFQIFREISWANHMPWVARRYRFYRLAMEYWQSVIPDGVIVESRYEELVADPYNQSRRLIESVGLDWNEDCLNYHQKSRQINTASLWQARQPVYKTSSKRWLNYAEHLVPLANELYEFLDQEDIDEFEKLGLKLKKPGILKKMFA